jgi:hypothetical protein
VLYSAAFATEKLCRIHIYNQQMSTAAVSGYKKEVLPENNNSENCTYLR